MTTTNAFFSTFLTVAITCDVKRSTTLHIKPSQKALECRMHTQSHLSMVEYNLFILVLQIVINIFFPVTGISPKPLIT
jgi:hypothetical protein